MTGKFLISNTNITDPNFFRTVVLMIEHDEYGAFGLVVNRKEELLLPEILDISSKIAEKIHLYQGGPVRKDAMFILHSDALAENAGQEIIQGVYLGGSRDLLEYLMDKPFPYHVFHGYSGWGPGQLEEELSIGSWVVVPATEEMIFHERPDLVWREALAYRGGIFAWFADKVRDPSLN